MPIRRRNTSRKAARKASVEARRLVPSDCAVWVRSWHTKDGGTAFSRFVLPTARLPFVASNELAIATKSIASVLSPATRSPWVPSNLCRGGTAIGKTHEERGNFNKSTRTTLLYSKQYKNSISGSCSVCEITVNVHYKNNRTQTDV